MRRGGGRIAAWAAVLLASLGLCGCMQNIDGTAEKTSGRDVLEEEKKESNSEAGLSETAKPVLTVMSIDASEPAYQKYIHGIEEELGIEIQLVTPDRDPNNRMAQFSTQLSTGDEGVDVYTLNDEMLCEFKRKGYLAPLPKDLVEAEILASYPQEYLQEICSCSDSLYAVPFFMDIYMFWVDQEDLERAGLSEIRTMEDFNVFLKSAAEAGIYGYGGAWEKTYAYNDIFEFINLFGGDCRDWNNEKTKQALLYLHDMAKQQYTSEGQLIDQYDQTLQKIINGKIGSAFLYSGSTYQAAKLDAYSSEKVHVQMLPDLGSNRTNVAAWNYAVNNASKNKELAYSFLSYIAGDEGTAGYSNAMHRLPARLDILQQDLDVPGIEIMQQYAEKYELTVRVFTDDPMEDIETIGKKFTSYITDEITLEELCREMSVLLKEE